MVYQIRNSKLLYSHQIRFFCYSYLFRFLVIFFRWKICAGFFTTVFTFPRSLQTEDWIKYVGVIPKLEELTYCAWITPFNISQVGNVKSSFNWCFIYSFSLVSSCFMIGRIFSLVGINKKETRNKSK